MKRAYYTCLLICALLIGIASCAKGSCGHGQKAKLKDLTGLDGCGMVIELQDGSYLEPTNLSEMDIEIVDGKKIWVSYHTAPNLASICMAGNIVEIDCIASR